MKPDSRGRLWSSFRTEPLALLCLLVLAPSLVAAAGGAGPVGPSPVEVENERREGDLTLVRLVPRASQRLGIRTVLAQRRSVRRMRTFGGIVMTPPGRAIQVAAPSEGTVLAMDDVAFPFPGTRVKVGAHLLRLLVVSGPELARARNVIEVAIARVAVGEEAYAADPSASADRELSAARESLAAARRRQRMLTGSENPVELVPVVITAPISGVVRSLAVSPGQAVPAGAPLVEIVSTDPVWVRAPIFAGDLASLAADQDASVRRLGGRTSRAATPVAGPPSADPDLGSVDLYFSVSNPSGDLRDGERVEVTLALNTSQRALTLPYAAVLYDIHGAAWVYEEVEDDVYVRRRIEIEFIEDGQVIAARGPTDGARIVVEGAAELFGAEFGMGR